MALVVHGRRRVEAVDATIATWTARDGRRIAVRPLDGESLGPFAAFVHGLSATSRAHRFLAPLNLLGPEAARRLVFVDQRTSVAWIAEEHATPAVIIAEVRYALTATGEAELALAVADDWQQSGLGMYLLKALLRHAGARGVERAWGHVRRDNDAALALAKRLEFSVRPDPDEPGLMRVVTALPRTSIAAAATDRPTTCPV